MIKLNRDMDRLTFFSMKLATAMFVIIILKLWDGAMIWVNNTNIWWFVLALVVFLLRAGMGCGVGCREAIRKERVERRVSEKKKK